MSPDNSLMVVCGGEVGVAAAHNAVATDDVAAVVGVAAADYYWCCGCGRCCGWGWGCGCTCCLGVAVLDETMHKFAVSFCVGGGDTKGK